MGAEKGRLCEDFREMVRQSLVGQKEPPEDWVTTATVVRDTGQEVFSAPSGQRKDNNKTFAGQRKYRRVFRGRG